jgi:hypothetical protein
MPLRACDAHGSMRSRNPTFLDANQRGAVLRGIAWVIIAGTRDMDFTQMGEALTKASDVVALAAEAGAAPSFESLTEVHGLRTRA